MHTAVARGRRAADGHGMVADLLIIFALGMLLAVCAAPDSPRNALQRWVGERPSPLRAARAHRVVARHGPVLRRLGTRPTVSDDEWNALVARLRDHD